MLLAALALPLLLAAGSASPTPLTPHQLEEDLPGPLRLGWDGTAVWEQALTVLDLIGVFAFAVSGALLAARKHYDIVGSLVLGALVGLGGGLTRDLILDRNPPAAFSDPWYLGMVVLAAALVWLNVVDNSRGSRAVQVFDAVGLAVFCVLGTRIALLAGFDVVPAALLGALSAVGGGLLRDVAAGEPPAIFGREGWYATPAFLGALTAALLGSVGWLNVVTATAVMGVVLLTRLVALRHDWQVAGSVRASHRRRLQALKDKGDQARSAEAEGDGDPGRA
ncbi:trimeric intracellular cation channel family protein [Micrococcus sp.]|uniref:trimeric intracellular cation channel family protein n=1 Tax=Micrococcus sp. TaxID=1271 RepID=UPI0026DB7A54|nr:TRIC cation channel family protein [Micrococcus sp.]MDO4239362.1 TRIC cation channel family protein [Micrococcus sp.]